MIPLITHFLDSFHLTRRERPLDAAERELAADALESFLLDEPFFQRGGATSDAADAIEQPSIARMNHPEAKWLSLLASVESQAVDLAARLERRAHANLIMREHLTMMSEQIRQLKAAQPVSG